MTAGRGLLVTAGAGRGRGQNNKGEFPYDMAATRQLRSIIGHGEGEVIEVKTMRPKVAPPPPPKAHTPPPSRTAPLSRVPLMSCHATAAQDETPALRAVRCRGGRRQEGPSSSTSTSSVLARHLTTV